MSGSRLRKDTPLQERRGSAIVLKEDEFDGIGEQEIMDRRGSAFRGRTVVEGEEVEEFAGDGIVSFGVQLVNRLRMRKRRWLIVDTINRTLSRSNGIDEDVALRKTVLITSSILLEPSEHDKKRLKISLEPLQARPLDVVFHSAGARERFTYLVQTLRSTVIEDTAASLERKQQVFQESASELTIHCATFNCSKYGPPRIVHKRHRNSPPEAMEVELEDLEEWLPPQKFDVYFVGLQECKAKFFSEWQTLILDSVNRNILRLGERENKEEKYITLASVSMWSIHGILIIRESLSRDFNRVRTDTCACGLGGFMGNKGAVGISVRYGDGSDATCTSFAFINSHLAAKASRLAQRSQNYQEICHSLLTQKKGETQGMQLLHAFDHVFWVGDLNFRLNLGRHGSSDEFELVKSMISGDRETLIHFDQLRKERERHNVFIGFREGDIAFRPTYRLEFGRKRIYSNKRHQNPSWTDRILWRSRPGAEMKVEQLEYEACEGIIFSDHRPVISSFVVNTGIGAVNDELLSPAGHIGEVIQAPTFGLQNMSFSCHRLDALQEAKLQALDDPAYKARKKKQTEKTDDDDDEIDDEDEDEADEVVEDGSDDETVEERRRKNRITRRKSTRKNSYARPILQEETTGNGFASGMGRLVPTVCDEQSPEYNRYVEKSEIGIYGAQCKIYMIFTSSFLDGAIESKPKAHAESTRTTLKYNWIDAELPLLRSFVSDPDLLYEQQITVMLMKVGNFKQDTLIGQAQIRLDDIVRYQQSWFTVPVLLNGVPAGILRGEVENRLAPQLLRAMRRSILRSVIMSQPTHRSIHSASVRSAVTSFMESDSGSEMESGDEVGSEVFVMEGEEHGDEYSFDGLHEENAFDVSDLDAISLPSGQSTIPRNSKSSSKRRMAHTGRKQSWMAALGFSRRKSGDIAERLEAAQNSIHNPLHQQSDIEEEDEEEEEEEEYMVEEKSRKGVETLPFEKLRRRKSLPAHILQTQLEIYLSDDEFQKVFGMAKKEFYTLKRWRQAMLKKNKGLF